MATQRKKKVIISDVSREVAEEAFATYAKADAEIQKITAEIDLQCAKIREKWADKLATLSGARDASFDVLQSFATEHQAELFAKKKSLEMAHGTIGFRTGTPKLKTLKGFTWASALELVKRILPGYVRSVDEIAKDKLLADRDSEAVVVSTPVEEAVPMADALAGCGLQVVQDETFYVEPKKEIQEQ